MAGRATRSRARAIKLISFAILVPRRVTFAPVIRKRSQDERGVPGRSGRIVYRLFTSGDTLSISTFVEPPSITHLPFPSTHARFAACICILRPPCILVSRDGGDEEEEQGEDFKALSGICLLGRKRSSWVFIAAIPFFPPRRLFL